MNRSEYSEKTLRAIYELGRTYFELGYFSSAERIFSGLLAVDRTVTPARLALGLTLLERGKWEDAASQLRIVAKDSSFSIEGRIGLLAVFASQGELGRLQMLVSQLEAEEGLKADYMPLIGAYKELVGS